MKEQADKSSLFQNSFRYKLISLFRVNIYNQSSTLSLLQTFLQTINYIQLLKFVIDYYISSWLASQLPVFLYLDFAYYSSFLSLKSLQVLLLFSIFTMNSYWIIQTIVFILKIKYSPKLSLIRKASFLFFRHLFLLPFFSILLGMYSCQTNQIFRPCVGQLTPILQFLYIISFILFSMFIGFQTFFNFIFLPNLKQYTRIKKSNHNSLVFFAYCMLCQVIVFTLNDFSQLVILNIFTLFLLIFLWWYQEQLQQRAKLIQFSAIFSILLGYIIVDFTFIFRSRIQIWVYLFFCCSLCIGTLQLRTYSMKFQLQNINKWPTLDIMIRQASTFKYYLSRSNEQMFKIYIHGYMQIHRQKCDNINCPSRVSLSDYDLYLISILDYDCNMQELLRLNNILKIIYREGYLLSPIPPQIQLENCIYHFMRDQYQLSFRNLLQIKLESLSQDGYYIYFQLKDMLSNKILSINKTQFLDLVTQLKLIKRQEELFKLFERAALINLQFWSLLQDDHPNFLKLNEVGIQRIKLDAYVQREFYIISQSANSQRIVALYSNYLQCIDNHEEMVMDILRKIIQTYKLRQKLVVHDWNNSSIANLLVSLQQDTFGKILNLNTSCASLLGYEKYQIINQSVKILLPDQLISIINSLLASQTSSQLFYISHKSGYLLRVSINSRKYNSMENGLTTLVTIKSLLQPLSCYCIIDKNNKILASSSSFVSLLSIDLKTFENQTVTSIFFQFSYYNVQTFKQSYTKDQFLKQQFSNRGTEKNDDIERYIIECHENYGVKFIEITRLKHQENTKMKSRSRLPVQITNFQFQVEVNTSKFKYIGTSNNLQSLFTDFNPVDPKNSAMQSKKIFDYEEGITTLRLRDNIIQLIEDHDATDSQLFINRNQSTSNIQVMIPRQDLQEIFSSKATYKQFLKDYKIGANLLWFMGLTVLIVFALYFLAYFIYHSKIRQTFQYSQQIVYQNLIIGTIAKQSSIVSQLQLLAQNKSSQAPIRILETYDQNIKFLEKIQLLGTSPFSIIFQTDLSWQTILSSQYISKIITFAIIFQNNLNGSTSLQEISSALQKTDPYIITFLLTGSIVKDALITAFNKRRHDIFQKLSSGITSSKIIVAIGVILISTIGILIMLWVRNLNFQKIRVFEIFLDISDPQIQYFSSITQRFLLSIHSDETTQIEEDMQIAKKTFSSTFSKKKSFKHLAFNKSLFFKLAFIPLLMTAFFFHTYTIFNSYFAFHILSIDYFALSAQGDYFLSTGLLSLQLSQYQNVKIDTSTVSQNIRLYYRNYLEKDEVSFGLYDNFHTTFNAIMISNICNGSQTPYGWVLIKDSCNLPSLYPNGSLLVLSSTLTQIQKWDQSFPLPFDFHLKIQILSVAQRILSEKLLLAQQQLSNSVSWSILQAILLWGSFVLIFGLVFWGNIAIKFVREVNQVKAILGMLPLSLVKQNLLASRYINRILKKKQKC